MCWDVVIFLLFVILQKAVIRVGYSPSFDGQNPMPNFYIRNLICAGELCPLNTYLIFKYEC